MSKKHSREYVDGFFLLDKPLGISSHKAVQKIKYLYNAIKAGHTGTLDPLATGMLPICLGEATKFSRFIVEADKCYQFTMQLGITTTTLDSEGEIVATKPVPIITPDIIADIIARFQGSLSQLPPMFSALKHQGQPLYKLARQGKEIERKPRLITVHALQFDHMDALGTSLTFTVKCTKGTYVRTLTEDIGNTLGCGAHVTVLRRLWGAPFEGHPMITVDELESCIINERVNKLYSVEKVLSTFFPTLALSSDLVDCLFKGRVLPSDSDLPPGQVILTSEGKFLGLGELCEGNRLIPSRLIQHNGAA